MTNRLWYFFCLLGREGVDGKRMGFKTAWFVAGVIGGSVRRLRG